MAENNDFGMGYAMGQDSNKNSGGMFGGSDAFWGIILLALLFGNGGIGGGFGGGFGGGLGIGMMAPWATQADVRAAVDQQTLINKLDQQTYGIADATYSLNNTITNGFHGVDRGLCDISHQMSDCCCQTQRLVERGFCDMGQAINMQTRDIIENQNANYRGMMDFLVGEKLASKDAKIAELNTQISQANQNVVLGARIDAAVAEILRRTGNDCPTAAYLVQPPTPVNFPTNGCGTVQFGGGWNNSGCGCGY